MPRYWPTREPWVPWGDIEPSDCREANNAEVELYRDTQVHGRAYRQIGMHVIGQYDRSLSLGLVCLRCERHGEALIPLTLSIPETPMAIHAEPVSVPRRLRKRWLAAVLLSLSLATPVVAQTLADNSEGRVLVAGNELLVDAKNLDAAAIRLGAPPEQGGLGKISFDALFGSRKEMVLFIGAQSPGRGGEFSLNLLRPDGGSTDDAMIKVLEVNHEGGFRFKLPVFFEAGTNAGGGLSSYPGCMSSGAWHFCQQGSDGNVVSYEVVKGQWCARWSAYHNGLIPKHTSPIVECRQ